MVETSQVSARRRTMAKTIDIAAVFRQVASELLADRGAKAALHRARNARIRVRAPVPRTTR